MPLGFKANVGLQSHSAKPTTNSPRFLGTVDRGRNHPRKDNAFFVTDFGIARPIHFHDSKFCWSRVWKSSTSSTTRTTSTPSACPHSSTSQAAFVLA